MTLNNGGDEETAGVGPGDDLVLAPPSGSVNSGGQVRITETRCSVANCLTNTLCK